MKLFTTNAIVILILLLPAAGNSQQTSNPVLHKICTGSCTGGMTSVTGWYDSKGKIAYYELSGDLSICPHATLILYDSKGLEALTIPNQPVDPKNKESIENLEKLHQKRKELLNGYTPAKPISCSEILK